MARKPLVALGLVVSWRSLAVRTALGLGAVAAVSLVVLGVVLRGGDRQASALLPILGTSALAWSAGVLIAFGGALGAFTTDHASGLRAYLRARGVDGTGYLGLRAAGLVAWVAGVTATGAVAGLLAALAAGADPARLTRAFLASLAYAVAFALALSAVSLATLGARNRVSGYALFLLVLVLPEGLAVMSEALLPSSFEKVIALPDALTALRASLAGLETGRDLGLPALGVVVLFTALGLGAARAEVARVDHEAADRRAAGRVAS